MVGLLLFVITLLLLLGWMELPGVVVFVVLLLHFIDIDSSCIALFFSVFMINLWEWVWMLFAMMLLSSAASMIV
jgi:hypothetical protein